MSKGLALLLACLVPVVAWAQPDTVSRIVGDWNGDGVVDRATVRPLATGSLDLVIQTRADDMHTLGQMRDIADENGLWSTPTLHLLNASSFEMFSKYEQGQMTLTQTITWTDDGFVVSKHRQEWIGSVICAVDYLTGTGVYTAVDQGTNSAFAFDIPPVKIEDWAFHDGLVPENCLRW